MANPTVVIAGATGDLGNRIARALVARGAWVRAFVRPGTDASKIARLEAASIEAIMVDPADVHKMAAACRGALCVVSALNGLRDVMIDRQKILLEAALQAGVPSFIPSDYSSDFTKTRPGDNRNFDLRRDFMTIADEAPIKVTSILNGAFMDMLGAEMPLLQPRVRRVLYWQSADQLLDFTTKDNVAQYTAFTALDPEAPRFLRIAGDSVSVRDLAATMIELSGQCYRPLWAGTIATLGLMISAAKTVAPGHGEAFPVWQGMQYMRDQFSGRAKLGSFDNDRYGAMVWTSTREHLHALAVGAIHHEDN